MDNPYTPGDIIRVRNWEGQIETVTYADDYAHSLPDNPEFIAWHKDGTFVAHRVANIIERVKPTRVQF